MAMNTLLKLESVSKSYGKTLAVDAVSFELRDGENIALLGESGSGKSSLLRLIAGFNSVNDGQIWMGDSILADKNQQVPPHLRKIGMVFQDHALFPHLSVKENIKFGLPKGTDLTKVDDLVKMTDLVGLESRYPKELSGGQQQRVAIARALAANPSILLLDEPFSSLDPSIKNLVRDETYRLLKMANTPSILVTHDIEDALAFAEHLMVLQDGKLIQNGKAEELYNNPYNSYVASLFGIINSYPHEEADKIYFFRPNQAQISLGSVGKWEGIVEKSLFHGRNYLSYVRGEGFNFVVETATSMKIGESVIVTPDSGTTKTTLL